MSLTRMGRGGAAPEGFSDLPPAGIPAPDAPQLVAFGFDDNAYSGYPESGDAGGFLFVLDVFGSRRNPAGKGNPATFDGLPAKATFFMKGDNIAPGSPERGDLVKRAWREALERGHEIGAHTYTHPHGIEADRTRRPAVRRERLSKDDWKSEIELCLDRLTRPWDPSAGRDDDRSGIGADRAAIRGFRTPYLEYGTGTFEALEELGFRYDASVEEGWQPDRDGSNYIWPYALGRGSPGDAYVAESVFGMDAPIVGRHPGLYEMPVYPLVAPPDELCGRYGTRRGLRARLKAEVPAFDEGQGKVTGLDWNIWFQYFMSAEDSLAVLEHSFDLRYEGNRCPLLLGTHADIYSDRYERDDLEGEDPARLRVTPSERRGVLEAFFDYVLAHRDARVAPFRDVLGWLERPAALGAR